MTSTAKYIELPKNGVIVGIQEQQKEPSAIVIASRVNILILRTL